MKKALIFCSLLVAATLIHADIPPVPKAGSKASTSGWQPLFDGKSFQGWMNASSGDVKGWQIIDGAMVGKSKSGDVWTKARYGNFVLEVEFKTTGNSGVFFRTDNPKDNVQTGIEVQVENPGGPDKHSVGALYDMKAPSKCTAKKGEWNKYVITCQGSKITVELNGEKVNEMDLDEWSEVGKNPDGTSNKYKKAVKEWKREGHIGFQDHGYEVAYRNIRIKALN